MKITKQMLPGIGLTIAWAWVAKLLSPLLPALGAEGIAILGGLVLGNTVFKQQQWAAGVAWAEKYVIQFGIALMGLTLTLATINQLGWQGVVVIVLQMTLTIMVVLILGGRVFKVSKESALLMGAGNAVCGTSAIAAVTPVVGANDESRRTAAATVSLTGVVLLLILPQLGPMIFGHQNVLVGALIGGTLQSVGQAVGAGAMVNGDVEAYATLFKMMRVILLTVVVLVFARIATPNRQKTTAVKSFSVRGAIPWFVATFVLFMLLNTFMTLPRWLTSSAHDTASFFGVINLAGIGLSIKWVTIKNSGARFMGYGLLTGALQVAVAFALIKLLMG
jgi:uncharacterized integral membrane protein (TIGR00698 family)